MMPMSANGLSKLIEEMGELTQVAGKMLAYPDTDDHPDGGEPLSIRLEKEMADVLAAIEFVAETHGLSQVNINYRKCYKLGTYRRWHQEPLTTAPPPPPQLPAP